MIRVQDGSRVSPHFPRLDFQSLRNRTADTRSLSLYLSSTASVLLAKTQIGLGVLALPSALDKLGGFVGILAIVVIGLVVTYANYVVGTFGAFWQ